MEVRDRDNENTIYIVYTVSRSYEFQLGYLRGIFGESFLADQRDIHYITQDRRRALAQYDSIRLGPFKTFCHSKFVIRTSLEKILPQGMMYEECVAEAHNNDIEGYSRYRLDWLIEELNPPNNFKRDLTDGTDEDEDFKTWFLDEERDEVDPTLSFRLFPEEIETGERIYIVVPMMVHVGIYPMVQLEDEENRILSGPLQKLFHNSFYESGFRDYNAILFMTRHYPLAKIFYDSIHPCFVGDYILNHKFIVEVDLDHDCCLYDGTHPYYGHSGFNNETDENSFLDISHLDGEIISRCQQFFS